MPSIKLTADLRERLRKDLLRHRFSKDFAALRKARVALANAVYLDIYKPSDRANMEGLPSGWLPERDYITARFGIMSYGYDRLYFNGSMGGDELSSLLKDKGLETVRRRVTDRHRDGCAKQYDAAHKLTTRFEEAHATLNDLRSRVSVAGKEINAVLGSVTTTGRLKEIWPEAASFVLPMERSAPALPAMPIGDLNKKLGLPAKEAA